MTAAPAATLLDGTHARTCGGFISCKVEILKTSALICFRGSSFPFLPALNGPPWLLSFKHPSLFPEVLSLLLTEDWLTQSSLASVGTFKVDACLMKCKCPNVYVGGDGDRWQLWSPHWWLRLLGGLSGAVVPRKEAWQRALLHRGETW